MIIYGSRGTQYATQELSGAGCPNCRKFGQLRVSLVSRYAHVYWIPLFPFQKIAVVECANCQAAWDGKAMPAELAEEVRQVKSQAHHPYWTWTGLLLLALAVAFGVVASRRHASASDTFLDAPRAGDIYTVRSDSANMYSLLKVRQVGGNSVELVENNYQTSDADPINSLNEPARYSADPFVVTRLDLQIMRRQGKITDVDRP